MLPRAARIPNPSLFFVTYPRQREPKSSLNMNYYYYNHSAANIRNFFKGPDFEKVQEYLNRVGALG